MNQKFLISLVAAWLTVIGLCASPASLAGAFSTTPSTNDGEPWRIAYYEGGPDGNYYSYLEATLMGLMDLGWIPKRTIPDFETREPQLLWRFMSEHLGSEYVDFLANGFYTAKWEQEQRFRNRRDFLERANSSDDIDLVIAMGTWAGKDLANDLHDVPTLVLSTSDPIGSGIIRSADDSGLDHVHARVDPRRYERQVRLFHDIIQFKRLGVAYEESIYGRSYAAMDSIEKVAEERRFEIVRCHTTSDIADFSAAGESVRECFNELAPRVDAVYVTRQGGVNEKTIPDLVTIANQHRVPTFYQSGSDGVRRGFLLSMSRGGGFRPVGRFLAATFAKVLNGAKPRELKQLYEEVPNLAINLKTAEVIGLYLYADVLAAADEIYHKVEDGY